MRDLSSRHLQENPAWARPTCTTAIMQASRLPERVRAPFASPACLCRDTAISPRARIDPDAAARAPADHTLQAAPESLSAYLPGGCAKPSGAPLFFRRERLSPRTLAPLRAPVRAACPLP